MAQDFHDTLRDRFSRVNLSVTFPDVLDNLIASSGDENWEIFKSNQIQPCKIFYENNKVNLEESKGVVFIHTHCKNKFSALYGEEYDAKFREQYVKLRTENGTVTSAQAQ